MVGDRQGDREESGHGNCFRVLDQSVVLAWRWPAGILNHPGGDPGLAAGAIAQIITIKSS
jgi:hypothetical protein